MICVSATFQAVTVQPAWRGAVQAAIPPVFASSPGCPTVTAGMRIRLSFEVTPPRARIAQVFGVIAIVAGASLITGFNIPLFRLPQLAHELGHLMTARMTGYEATGLVLDPGGPAAAYTSLDPERITGVVDQLTSSAVLAAGIGGEVTFAIMMFRAARLMKTGIGLLAAIGTAVLAAALLAVPGPSFVVIDSRLDTPAMDFTRKYLLVSAAVLFLVAAFGGIVCRVTIYTLCAVAVAGLAASLRELWWPSQEVTDAVIFEQITSIPAVAWDLTWTVGIVAIVSREILALSRCANGSPIRQALGLPTYGAAPGASRSGAAECEVRAR